MARQSFMLALFSVTILCFVSSVKGTDTVNCAFDQHACEWEEVGRTHCWLISRSQDLAGVKGYLYFNDSCSTAKIKTAEIRTKRMSSFWTPGEDEFHFWYYMQGEGEGELSIVDQDSSEGMFHHKPHVSFNCQGDHGPQWYHAHVKIPIDAEYMGIIAKTKGRFLIAIDNITADNHGPKVPKEQTCPPKPVMTSNSPTKTRLETSIRTVSPSLPSIIKSTLYIESTTVRTEGDLSSTPLIDRSTSINSSVTPEKQNLLAVKSPPRTSAIVGGCLGALSLLMGALVVIYFTYRRIRVSSMYSFKKEQL